MLMCLEYEGILGLHDFQYVSYRPGRRENYRLPQLCFQYDLLYHAIQLLYFIIPSFFKILRTKHVLNKQCFSFPAPALPLMPPAVGNWVDELEGTLGHTHEYSYGYVVVSKFSRRFHPSTSLYPG